MITSTHWGAALRNSSSSLKDQRDGCVSLEKGKRGSKGGALGIGRRGASRGKDQVIGRIEEREGRAGGKGGWGKQIRWQGDGHGKIENRDAVENM